MYFKLLFYIKLGDFWGDFGILFNMEDNLISKALSL